MIIPELRQKALDLRRKGHSYNVISRETGISKGTLSYIYNRVNLPEEILLNNKKRNREESGKRIMIVNAVRKAVLENKYHQIEHEAEKTFQIYKNDTIFIASLMLYLGEGDKSDIGHSLRISNTDPYVLKIFIEFVKKYCHIPRENIKFWMLGYKDLDIDKCISWWKKELDLKETNMYKTQIITGKHKSKRLLYGVGNITILGGKTIKVGVLRWIKLMCEYLTRP